MSTFEELGLGPEMIEALAEAGLEVPTPLQEGVIPVLRRGNNLVARAGPGAGVLVAVAAPILDRLGPDAEALRLLVLTPTRDRAEGLARSAAPLARAVGSSVAALGSTWARADDAAALFATPADALDAVGASRVKLDALEAFVVDGAAALAALDRLEAVDTLAGLLPAESQRVVVALPPGEEVEAFAERHARRAVHVPPRSAVEADDSHIPRRGRLRYHGVDGPRMEALLRVLGPLVAGGTRAVAVFFPTDDEAASVGQALELRGFPVGAPGDSDAVLWLSTDESEAREAIAGSEDPDGIVTVSYRVPPGPDSLDRRHGGGGDGHVLVRPREIPHLRETAREAGYALEAGGGGAKGPLADEVARFREVLERALEEEDLAPHLLLLEPLLERYGGAEVAAAAAAVLRKDRRGAAETASPARVPPEPSGAGRPGPSWVRLFMSLGDRDEIGPGDVLGAITGEAGIDGSQVGRIDIRDTFSLVEVDPAVAGEVIRAMNGITVKGRSLRVDYHRSRRGGRGGPGSRRGGGEPRS